ncbi:MAG: Sec-independent protein translocase protein TatB [Alphaproteobacteria bacterium]
MFDIGWQELFIIGLVTIIVIGPKDLPRVLRAVTLGMRKVRSMARDFQDGIDELAREAELQELRKEIEKASSADLEQELQSIADPAREVEQSMRDIGRSLDEPAPTSLPPKPEPAREKPAGESGAGGDKPGGGE